MKYLGDQLEDFFKKTGIKKMVDAIMDDCGCTERRDALNKYHQGWTVKRKMLNNVQIREGVIEAYENITGKKWGKRTECSQCNNRKIKELLEHPDYIKVKAQLDIAMNGTTQDKLTNSLKVAPNELSLKELRKLHPNIKSVSKQGFLNQIA